MDERTERQLNYLSVDESVPTDEMALRLLRRALRATRPKPVYDMEAIREHVATFAEEDALIADSDSAHRASLLAAEDVA